MKPKESELTLTWRVTGEVIYKTHSKEKIILYNVLKNQVSNLQYIHTLFHLFLLVINIPITTTTKTSITTKYWK